MGAFFPLDSHLMVYFSIWEMHGFPRKFPTVWENPTKPMVWGKSGKLMLILFLQYGCFFPIRFPSHGILHQMGNVLVCPSISHSTEKCNKTHRMGRNWEIGTHTFPIIQALFPLDSHFMVYSITWDTSSHPYLFLPFFHFVFLFSPSLS